MELKYKNLSLTLNEDIENLKREIEELEKLDELIRQSADYYLLNGKTQLIGKENLSIARDRRQHTENTSVIAKRTIRLLYETAVDDEIKETEIYKLNLQRELLYAQIIAEAHDLGHTPFGHLGERVLNRCFQQADLTQNDLNRILTKRKEMFGENYEINQGHNETFRGSISFEHNEQSAKLLYDLVKYSDIDENIVNVNRIIQGILSHSTSRVTEENIPNDLVIQTIRQSDKIDYVNGDIDEAAEIINIESIHNSQLVEFIKMSRQERIKSIVQKLVDETTEKGCIDDDMEGMREVNQIKKIYQPILFTMDVDGKMGLLTGENVERITLMLTRLYSYYKDHPEKIPYKSSYTTIPINKSKASKRILLKRSDLREEITTEEKVINLLVRYDNAKVEKKYKSLVIERIMNGKGYGIEPITKEEIEEVKLNYYLQRVRMEKVRQELDGMEHSETECEESLRLFITRLIENALTQKGRDRMAEVRKSHEEENKDDEKFVKLRDFYDENPSERLILQQKKAEPIMQKLKDDWNIDEPR